MGRLWPPVIPHDHRGADLTADGINDTAFAFIAKTEPDHDHSTFHHDLLRHFVIAHTITTATNNPAAETIRSTTISPNLAPEDSRIHLG